MAILADAAAVILLLSLNSSDVTKNQQILDRKQDMAANRAIAAAQSAAAYLTENPRELQNPRRSHIVSDSSEDD